VEWVVIVEMIIALIQECMENRTEDEIISQLRNPRGREVLAIRRVLIKTGLSGKELRDGTREVLDELNRTTDNELRDLVQQARSSS